MWYSTPRPAKNKRVHTACSLLKRVYTWNKLRSACEQRNRPTAKTRSQNRLRRGASQGLSAMERVETLPEGTESDCSHQGARGVTVSVPSRRLEQNSRLTPSCHAASPLAMQRQQPRKRRVTVLIRARHARTTADKRLFPTPLHSKSLTSTVQWAHVLWARLHLS